MSLALMHFDWNAWLGWLFRWPPTVSEFVLCLVCMGVLGASLGVIWTERRNQRWVEEHTKELEDLKAQLTAVGKQNR